MGLAVSQGVPKKKKSGADCDNQIQIYLTWHAVASGRKIDAQSHNRAAISRPRPSRGFATMTGERFQCQAQESLP